MKDKFTYHSANALVFGMGGVALGWIVPNFIYLYGVHIIICISAGLLIAVPMLYKAFIESNVPCEFSADNDSVTFRVHRKVTVIPYEKINEVQFFAVEKRSMNKYQRGVYPEEHLRFTCTDGVYEFKNALPRIEEGVDPLAQSKFMGLNAFVLARRAEKLGGMYNER